MNEVLFLSPPLPMPVLLAVTVCFLPVLAMCLRQARGTAAAFLLIAVWLRVVSGAFNEITFARIGGALSVNALMSVVTVAIGVLLVPRRHFTALWVLPIYALLILIVFSGLMNGLFVQAFEMAFKWGYVIVIAAATHQAMRENGMTRTLTLLMWCYAPIFVFQLISLAAGIAKAGENDGSASYIGGYAHEGVFSVMALTFAALGYFARDLRFSVRLGLILLGTVSIVVANYRTTILAIAPMMIGFVAIGGITRFLPSQRLVVAAVALPLGALVLVGMLSSDGIQERFADLFRIFLEGDELFKPQDEFDEDSRRVLSGRLYIWAGYLQGYAAASDMQLLFGLGPNSWVGTFKLYAHNMVVSYLYELGAFGVAILLAIWATAVIGAFKIRDKAVRMQALLALAGFIILNMATMPHWQIEGNILFAVILATILFESSASQPTGRERLPRFAASIPSRLALTRRPLA